MDDEPRKDLPPVPPAKLTKRWMSEPNLLGDYDDGWEKRSSQISDISDSLSFTEEVAQPNLTHVTKQRVQFRPKRRPPSRDFIKSRASMDFEFAVPEQINEEEEGIAEEVEKTDDLPPLPPPKPKDNNAWKLPTIDPEMVLRKTSSAEPKRTDITKQDSVPTTSSETSEESIDYEHSPGKKQKRRPRLNLKIFKYRRNRREKETEHKPERRLEETGKDDNMNLRHCVSVDSGTRPLGGDQPKNWLHRRFRRKSHEKRNLNWLLGLFNKKDGAHERSATTSDTPAVVSNHGNTNSTSTCDMESPETNGDVNKPNNELINDTEENERHESVSELKKRFEKGL